MRRWTDETVLVPSGCISSGAGWQLVDAVSCGVRDESGLIEDTVYVYSCLLAVCCPL